MKCGGGLSKALWRRATPGRCACPGFSALTCSREGGESTCRGPASHSDGVAGPLQRASLPYSDGGWSFQRASLPTAMVWLVLPEGQPPLQLWWLVQRPPLQRHGVASALFPAQHPRGESRASCPVKTLGSGCAGLSSPMGSAPTRSAEPSRCPSTALHHTVSHKPQENAVSV